MRNELRNLGRFLKSLREKKGLTLAEVAEAIGYGPSYVYYLEAGRFKSVSAEVLTKFADLFQVDIRELLSEAGYMPRTGSDELPEFAIYLRSKYGLTEEAIQDLIDYKEFVEKKYGKKAHPRRKA